MATAYADAVFNRLFLQPLLTGAYPAPFLRSIPLPSLQIADGDMERVQVPLDFIGINCYYRLVVSSGGDNRPDLPYFLFDVLSDQRSTGGHADLSVADPNAMRIENAFGRSDGQRTAMGWEIWPRALHDVLLSLTREYAGIPIEVCESGCAFDETPDENGVVVDTARIAYHEAHLRAVVRRDARRGKRAQLPRLEPVRQFRMGVGLPAAIRAGGRGLPHPAPHAQGLGAMVSGRLPCGVRQPRPRHRVAARMPEAILFSDVDGTLLGTDGRYAMSAAELAPALSRLEFILASSRTVLELSRNQRDLGIEGPVVAENGAVVAWPSVPALSEVGVTETIDARSWQIVLIGTSAERLRSAVQKAARRLGTEYIDQLDVEPGTRPALFGALASRGGARFRIARRASEGVARGGALGRIGRELARGDRGSRQGGRGARPPGDPAGGSAQLRRWWQPWGTGTTIAPSCWPPSAVS